MWHLKYFKLLFVLILLFPISFAISDDYSIKLLAVVEQNNVTKEGTIATMNLKLIQGNGDVFFDTSSLTQLDTQISIKIAKEIACNYLDYDCDKYDFLYQINADSSIIGGPSAGGAATVLTIGALSNTPLNKSISMTGTINSAGFIGNVGAVFEKIGAASKNDISLVLVPYDSANYSFENIGVKKIYSLDQALYYLTNQKLGSIDDEITFDDSILLKEYNQKMEVVADFICNRTNYLRGLLNVSNSQIHNSSIEFLDQKNYYSAASYCFRSNIDYHFKYLNQSEFNQTKIYQEILTEYNSQLNEVNSKKINSLNDLQVIFIIKDRLDDLNENIQNLNSSNISKENQIYYLAYSLERLNTIDAWTKFYSVNMTDNLTNIDLKLKGLCFEKIEEAKNRLDYFKFILPNFYEYLKFNEFEDDFTYDDVIDCINKATFIKSRTDVILSSLGNNDTEQYFGIKKMFAAKMLKKNFDNNILPIMGYSYYQYAESLKAENQTTEALIYLENAIELSSINDYLIKSDNDKLSNKLINSNIIDNRLNIVISLLILLFVIDLYLIFRIRYIKSKNKQIKKFSNPEFSEIKDKIKKI